MAAQTTRTIHIKNDVTGLPGLKKVAENLANINRNTQKTAKSMNSLSSSFGRAKLAIEGVIAGFSLRALAGAADEIQLLRDRLTVFTGSSEAAEDTLGKLASAAVRTRSSLAGLGTIYNRIALATNELGLSQQAMIDTVEVLQNTFRLNGATMAEATGAAIQLSQGLSSGQLRGQELRSVMEANSVLAEILAKEFGVMRGQLIKLAEKGVITSSRVLKALAKNMDDVNSRASNLGTTIEQGLTITFDAFKLKIGELNKEFDVSGKFNKGLEVIRNNMDGLFKVITLAVTSGIIYKFIGSINAMRDAIVLLQSTSLVGLVANILKISTALVISAGVIDKFSDGLEGTARPIQVVRKELTDATVEFEKFDKKLKQGTPDADITRYAVLRDRVKRLTEEKNKLVEIQKKELKTRGDNKSLKDTVEGLTDSTIDLKTTKQKFTEALKEINQEFRNGEIDVEQYASALDSIEIRRATADFNNGVLTLDAYNKKLAEIQYKTDGVSRATSAYSKQVGTWSDQIAWGVGQTFNRLEDSLVEFTKKGKFEFRKFTEAVLEDLNRILIRSLILQPLANAITAGITAGATSSGTTTGTSGATGNTIGPGGQSIALQAHGGAFIGGIQPFASGGIVNYPTLFRYGGGKTGLMGEAGSEAIMPLRRTPQGDLGVIAQGGKETNVTVNVINNNSDSQVETSESNVNGERVLNVVISRKIKEAFASGQMDKTMGSLYGVSRKGV